MRILVIEDEPRILGFLRSGLEAEGFVVDGAGDGPAALARVRTERYELVILDLQPPGIDDLQLLGELCAEQPALPVLILSARTDLATKLRSFELGADDYLSKPFSFDELVARVRVRLRRDRTPDTDSVIRAGLLVLDLTRRRATVADHVADLSNREFRLLYHLASHPGQIISRERLLSEVWGYGFDPGSNLVDVCVRRLRKKLGPDSPIETVRRVGYRLVVA